MGRGGRVGRDTGATSAFQVLKPLWGSEYLTPRHTITRLMSPLLADMAGELGGGPPRPPHLHSGSEQTQLLCRSHTSVVPILVAQLLSLACWF